MSEWKDQVNDHLKTQNETLLAQNEMLIKMSTKVDLMWKAFLGVITIGGLTLLERIFDVI